MPKRETVEAFIAQVVGGDHVGAIRDWYTENASMQENQAPPRVGRALLMKHEAEALARSARVDTEMLAPPVIDGDRVVIHWRFTFHPKAGAGLARLEELAWQLWSGDKIAAETFFL